MDPSYNNLGGLNSGGQPVSSATPQQPIVSSQQTTSVSSGTGDIVLAPGKKSHKGIIIAIILAVLAIGGFFAVMFLTSKSNNVNISDNVKMAFNKYANYLLYGEDSDKALEGGYDEDEIYRLDEVRDENAQIITNYFKTANELLTNFESLAKGTANGDLITVVDNYRANFELVRLTFGKEYISEEGLVDEVLNNNLEDTKTWIANKYASLVKSNYENVKEYAEAEISYYQLYAEYLEKAKDAGCLNMEEGLICEDYSDDALESQIDDASDEAGGMVLNANYAVLRGCWGINKILNGEVKNEE